MDSSLSQFTSFSVQLELNHGSTAFLKSEMEPIDFINHEPGWLQASRIDSAVSLNSGIAELFDALQSVIAWALQAETGNSHKARIEKPITFRKARTLAGLELLANELITTQEPVLENEFGA